MKKIFFPAIALSVALTSCVSKKKFTALQEQQKETQDKLSQTKLKLAEADASRKAAEGQIDYLKTTNYKLLNNVGNLSTLSTKEAQNLEKSLEALKEKDLQIKGMNEAITRKDSVTLALVTSLKGALGDLNDDDVSIQVDKGVVYVSLSDKLLFKSGSYEVADSAKKVLGKVAKIVNAKPELDIMVEGHTDSKDFKRGNLIDNWDLSVKRATAIVRVLQEEHNVEPKRLTAAGRSYYLPISNNETDEGRAANRRTRIVVLPKLDQFYNLIEEGLGKAK